MPAAVTMLTGDIATDIVNQSQRKIDMADRIAELEPDNAPFVALMGRGKKIVARSPKFEWLESQSMPRFTTLTASATSAATSLSIASAVSGWFRIGDGVRITETGEFVQVTAVSSTALGVTRAIQEGSIGVSAAASTSATSAAGLYIVNNANAEGATIRTIKAVKVENQYNYTEIIRTPFGVTNTTVASDFYGQYTNEQVRLQHNAGLEHDRMLESTFFWGARKQDTSTAGAPLRFSGGLFEFITTNVTTGVGALTRATWETFLRSGFRYGSAEKYLFASPLVCAALDGFIWNSSATGNGNAARQNFPVGENTVGVIATRYVCSQGAVNIVMKRHWNDSADLRGMAFLVDMNNLAIRPLRTRDTFFRDNIQQPSADSYEGEYLTETGLMVQLEATHARLAGVTS